MARMSISVNTLYRWMKDAAKYNGKESNEKRKVFRPGKTAHDRIKGRQAQNMDNKQARASWCNRTRPATGGNLSDFPWHTCNGKRNRTRVTGKGKQPIVVTYVAPK